MVEQIKALAMNPNALHLRKGQRAGSPYSGKNPRNIRSKSRGNSAKRDSCASASAGLEGINSVPRKMQKAQTEVIGVSIEQIDGEARDVYKVIHGRESCHAVVPIDSQLE